MTGGAINIPLKDGKSINIPVDRITYDPESNQVKFYFIVSDDLLTMQWPMRWGAIFPRSIVYLSIRKE